MEQESIGIQVQTANESSASSFFRWPVILASKFGLIPSGWNAVLPSWIAMIVGWGGVAFLAWKFFRRRK